MFTYIIKTDYRLETEAEHFVDKRATLEQLSRSLSAITGLLVNQSYA